jgi:hypothetical protein
MPNKMFFVAALFAALLSTASAQTLPVIKADSSISASWLGASTDVSGEQLLPPAWEASDYLVTAYLRMSGDTTGLANTDETCASLTWSDEFNLVNPLVIKVCSQETGFYAPASLGAGSATIHIATGGFGSLTASLGYVSTGATVAGWTVPHTYNLIVTATKLNP